MLLRGFLPLTARCGATLVFTAASLLGCDDASSSDGGVNGGDAGLTPTWDGALPDADAGNLGDGNVMPSDGGVPPISDDASIPTEVEAMTGDPALDAMRGDYLVEFHTISMGNEEGLGTVTTESITYGVLRVVADGTGLAGTEYLCHNDTVQTATGGTVTTTVSDLMWPNLTPVRRTLVVDTAAGTWSSPGAMRRQGWSENAAQMPTDPATQAGDFLDPDMDGRPGVASRVTGEATLIGAITITADCEYDLVSSSTTRYDGALSPDGLLQSGQITSEGSQVHALTANQLGGNKPCMTSDINGASTAPATVDELRLVRVASTWLATAGSCPSLPDFQTALP